MHFSLCCEICIITKAKLEEKIRQKVPAHLPQNTMWMPLFKSHIILNLLVVQYWQTGFIQGKQGEFDI